MMARRSVGGHGTRAANSKSFDPSQIVLHFRFVVLFQLFKVLDFLMIANIFHLKRFAIFGCTKNQDRFVIGDQNWRNEVVEGICNSVPFHFGTASSASSYQIP